MWITLSSLRWELRSNMNSPVFHSKRSGSGYEIFDCSCIHQIIRSESSKVGRLVMPQLMKIGMEAEEAMMTMHQVRAAYNFVPGSYSD